MKTTILKIFVVCLLAGCGPGVNITPTVTAVVPALGTTAGGDSVVIVGTAFVVGATVTIGGALCTPATVASSTQIACTTPPGAAGLADVVVTNPGVNAAAVILTAGFTYQ